jgi:phage terminase large subunit-like protein
LLHPVRESKVALDELKASMGTMEFSAQYQQAPVPIGGNLIKWSWFKFYDQAPAPSPSDKIIISWHTALSSSQLPDYSACVVLLVRHQSIYILDVIRARFEYPDLSGRFLRTITSGIEWLRLAISLSRKRDRVLA